MLNIDKAISSIDTLLHSFGFYSRPMTSFELEEQDKEKITPVVSERKLNRLVTPVVRDMEDEFMKRIVRYIKDGEPLSGIDPDNKELKTTIEEGMLELLSISGFEPGDDDVAVSWAKSKAALYADKIAQDMKVRVIGQLLDWYIKSRPSTRTFSDIQKEVVYEFFDPKSDNYGGFGFPPPELKVEYNTGPPSSDISAFRKSLEELLAKAGRLGAGSQNIRKQVHITDLSDIPEREKYLLHVFNTHGDEEGIKIVDNALRARLTGSMYIKAAENNIAELKADESALGPLVANYWEPDIDPVTGHAVLKSTDYTSVLRDNVMKRFEEDAYQKQVYGPLKAAEELIQDSPSFYVSPLIPPEFRAFRGDVDAYFRGADYEKELDHIIDYAAERDPVLKELVKTSEGRFRVVNLFKTILKDRSAKLKEADKILQSVRDFVGKGTTNQSFVITDQIAESEPFTYKDVKNRYGDIKKDDVTVKIYNPGKQEFVDVYLESLYKRRIIEQVLKGNRISAFESSLVGVQDHKELVKDIENLKKSELELKQLRRVLELKKDERTMRELVQVYAKNIHKSSPDTIAKEWIRQKYSELGKIGRLAEDDELNRFLVEHKRINTEFLEATEAIKRYVGSSTSGNVIPDLMIEEAELANSITELENNPLRNKYLRYVYSVDIKDGGWVDKDKYYLTKETRRYNIYEVSTEQAIEQRRDELQKEIERLKLQAVTAEQEVPKLQAEIANIDKEISRLNGIGGQNSLAAVGVMAERRKKLNTKLSSLWQLLSAEGKENLAERIANIEKDMTDTALHKYVMNNPPESLREVVNWSEDRAMHYDSRYRNAFTENVREGSKLFSQHTYKTYGALATLKSEYFMPEAAVDASSTGLYKAINHTQLQDRVAGYNFMLNEQIRPLLFGQIKRKEEVEKLIHAATQAAHKSLIELDKEKKPFRDGMRDIQGKISEHQQSIKAIENQGISRAVQGREIVAGSYSSKAFYNPALGKNYDQIAEALGRLQIKKSEYANKLDEVTKAYEDSISPKNRAEMAAIELTIAGHNDDRAVLIDRYKTNQRHIEFRRYLITHTDIPAHHNYIKEQQVKIKQLHSEAPYIITEMKKKYRAEIKTYKDELASLTESDSYRAKNLQRLIKKRRVDISLLSSWDEKNPVLQHLKYFEAVKKLNEAEDRLVRFNGELAALEAEERLLKQYHTDNLNKLAADLAKALKDKEAGQSLRARTLGNEKKSLEIAMNKIDTSILEHEIALGKVPYSFSPEDVAAMKEHNTKIEELKAQLQPYLDDIAEVNRRIELVKHSLGEETPMDDSELSKLRRELEGIDEELKGLRRYRAETKRALDAALKELEDIEKYEKIKSRGGFFGLFEYTTHGTGFNFPVANSVFTGTTPTNANSRYYINNYLSDNLEARYSYGNETGFARTFSGLGDKAERYFKARWEKPIDVSANAVGQAKKTAGINKAFSEKGTFARSFSDLLKERYLLEGEKSVFMHQAQNLYLMGKDLIDEGIAYTDEAAQLAQTKYRVDPRNIPVNTKDIKFKALAEGPVPGVPSWMEEMHKRNREGRKASSILEGVVENNGAKGAVAEEAMRSKGKRVLSDIIDALKDAPSGALKKLAAAVGIGAISALGVVGISRMWEAWKHPRDERGRFKHVYKSGE